MSEGAWKLLVGDCRERLQAVAAESVDEMGLLDAAGKGEPVGGPVWVEEELFPAA